MDRQTDGWKVRPICPHPMLYGGGGVYVYVCVCGGGGGIIMI